MALPVSLSTVTVIGTYVDLLGNPVRGSLSIRPQTILKESTEKVAIIPVVIQKNFDATGFFSVELPVTNDPDVSPQPFIYEIEENFSGGRIFNIALPLSVAGTTQNLADLLPAISISQSIYVSTDQYQGLLTRYNSAEKTRFILVNAASYDDQAALYAEEVAKVAEQLDNYNPTQLMLLGV